MNRKAFIRVCAGGSCSCLALAGAARSVPGQAAAEPSPEDMDRAELTWQLGASRHRFARLVAILGEELGEAERRKILRRLGAECAQSYTDLFAKYRGDLTGFLDEIRRQWVAEATWDEKTGLIRIVDRADRCTCPLVDPEKTPVDFCECTLGWQEAAYSAVLKKPVRAELEESIRRGHRRCVFRIRIL